MRATILLYGSATDVSNYLSNTPLEAITNAEIAMALSNALTKIAQLEQRLEKVDAATRQANNVASCLANGILPD